MDLIMRSFSILLNMNIVNHVMNVRTGKKCPVIYCYTTMNTYEYYFCIYEHIML